MSLWASVVSYVNSDVIPTCC